MGQSDEPEVEVHYVSPEHDEDAHQSVPTNWPYPHALCMPPDHFAAVQKATAAMVGAVLR